MKHSESELLHARAQAKEIWKLLDYMRGASPISDFRSLAYAILFIRYMQTKSGQHFDAPRFYSFHEISQYIRELIKACSELGFFHNDLDEILSGHIERILLQNSSVDEENVRWAIKDGFNNKNNARVDLTLTVLNNLFSENESRSGSEFYTPTDVNKLVVGLGLGLEKFPKTICDPFAGGASTAFSFFEELDENVRDRITINTQEMNPDVHFQIIISRILKGIRGIDYLGDSLKNPIYSEDKYDLIASFPPFGLKVPKQIRNEIIHMTNGEWLHLAEGLPNTRSDWFIALSMLSSLNSNGKLIIGMTLGAFTRTGAEARIREELVAKGVIETVILLPKNIHYSTTIPTVIVILNSGRYEEPLHFRPVRFVDSSLFYEPKRGRNILTLENIQGILNSCREDGRFSVSVSQEDIAAKDFNLDPTLYVNKTIKISGLTLNNFRGYRRFSVSIHKALTVLVGENGAGKTSVLEAIACGLGPFLTAMPDAKGKLIRNTDIHIGPNGIADHARISIDTSSSLSWDLATKGAKIGNIAKIGTAALSDFAKQIVELNEEYPLIAYYGTNRTLSPNTGKVLINPFEKEVRGDGYDSALDARINYSTIKNWFSKIEVDELKLRDEQKNYTFVHPAKTLIKDTVKSIVDRTEDVSFNKNTNDVVISWKNEENELISLSLEQLSEGYRNMVALTIDLVRRAYLLNPNSQSPLNVNGVVLIDEIELHLHPRWQQKVLTDLTRLFINVQFIVTTHSPQVLSSIHRDSIRIVDSTSDEAKFISNSTYGAESSRLLEDVLGSTTRPQHLEIVQKLNRYTELVEINQWDIAEALELKNELYKWGGQEETELIRLETDVRLREYDRDNEES
jgi:predicted ATP-binding protein involved in virulence